MDTGNKSIIDIFIATLMDLKKLFFPSSLRILFPESNAPDPFWFFSQAMAAELFVRFVNLKNPSSLSTVFVIMMPQRGHHILAEASAVLTGVHLLFFIYASQYDCSFLYHSIILLTLVLFRSLYKPCILFFF